MVIKIELFSPKQLKKIELFSPKQLREIELFSPKQLKIGQKDNLEETPDFKSKFPITALIISPI